MIKRLSSYAILILGIACLFFGCAKIVSPTGGAKDSTAPQILKGNPEDKQVNFSGNSIELSFDEFVQLGNTQDILISPYMKERPELKVRGKKVILNFKEALRDSTTYSIDFGSVVKDLNEGNEMAGLQLSFSTGPILDTLEISGNVLDAESLKAQEGIIVGLYDSENPAVFETQPPLYLSKTDKSGNWKIGNVAPGEYLLTALQDDDFDFFYSQRTEAIAFRDATISIPDSLNNYSMYLFSVKDTNIVFVEKKTISLGKDILVLKGPVNEKEFKLEWLNDTINVPSQILPTAKSGEFHVYYKFESGQKPEQAILKMDEKNIDTLRFKSDFEKDSLQQNKFSIAQIKEGVVLLEKGDSVQVKFEYPILPTPGFQIKFSKDSTALSELPVASANGKIISFSYAWEEGAVYQIEAIPEAVRDLFDRPVLDTLRFQVRLRTQDDYGDLQLYFPDWEEGASFLYSLKNPAGTVLTEGTITNDTMLLKGVRPGTGRILVVEDINANGRWDPGDYSQALQPEPVYSPTAEISIRAGWDTEAVVPFSIE